MRDSTITDLRVLVNSANAASDLAQIIGIVDAGPGHPLWLTWHIVPREDLTQQYDGSVDCRRVHLSGFTVGAAPREVPVRR